MKRLAHACLFAATLLVTTAAVAEDKVIDTAAAQSIFANPPRQYATAPLWVWNDMLTEEQIRGTLRDLASQKVMQAFVHPRPGMMTPYLSDDWFRLWKVALDEAEKLDMNIWIYDENSYPSGFAGGHVPEIMPESRGRGLVFREEKQLPKLTADTVAVYRMSADTLENITEEIRSGDSLPSGDYLVASVRRATNSPWHGDRCYVDLMYPGVTEKFLEVTLDAYKENIGDQFGKRVLGAFTDEPNVRPAGGLPWTDHLPAAFQERWGYDLRDHLPSLVRPIGPWKQVRHDYYQVVLDQFIQHFAQPYYNWCADNGLAFTGHYWDHEWPNCIGVTDNMAMSAWQQMPGIDCLMNQYREDTHAQFGNVRFVKEVQSICNQLGRERFLCEAYGAGGWDLRFEDMKRIADWLGVLGVNLFDEHLSYITLRGARKADHPQSFSYHEPWWDSYHVMAQYLTRLSAAMSMGQQRNHVLVIQPTTTAWMYQLDPASAPQLNELGKSFFDLLMGLERAQVEYDLGCEDVMVRHGATATDDKTGNAVITVGQAQYRTLVLPPLTETVREPTMQLLEDFAAAGGTILSCGPPPALVDGRPSERGGKLAQSPNWKPVDSEGVTELLLSNVSRDGCAIERAADDKGILFHQRRQLTDGELLLLVNTSITDPSRGAIATRAQSVQKWDLFSGSTSPYPFTREAGTAKLSFELPPSGSLLLLLSNEPGKPASVIASSTTTVKAHSPIQIERLEENVLTLDYVDITAGGETQRNVLYNRANELAWQKNGLPRNPWNSAVQYQDELISKTFPPESGFEVTYRFTIDGPVPAALQIVIERPDIYEITCNGSPIQAKQGDWWLDKAFGKIDITSAAHPGENTVTLKAQPFTIYHEIAAAYVLGEFSLRPAATGFVIVAPKIPGITSGLAHSTDLEGVAWLTAGVKVHDGSTAAEGQDGEPTVVFDLGPAVDLSAIDVWNYNEAGLPLRGVKSMRVLGSATLSGPNAWSQQLGTFELASAPGGPGGAKTAFAQRLAVAGKNVRYVKFQILSNHNGVTFPTTDGSRDGAFVGLSEVRFQAAGKDGKPTLIKDVKIESASSELVQAGGFDRRAAYLVDGSGLGDAAVGWNQQGMPFYSSGVAYRQSFEVANVNGRYKVAVPSWYGSVAKVLVNGQLCGHLVSQPWEVDVTNAVRAGENQVEVLVIGTLKNTLGPHHSGPVVGTAWPGMFQQGPAQAPPGSAYHTLGYGLFAPFTLQNMQ